MAASDEKGAAGCFAICRHPTIDCQAGVWLFAFNEMREQRPSLSHGLEDRVMG